MIVTINYLNCPPQYLLDESGGNLVAMCLLLVVFSFPLHMNLKIYGLHDYPPRRPHFEHLAGLHAAGVDGGGKRVP